MTFSAIIAHLRTAACVALMATLALGMAACTAETEEELDATTDTMEEAPGAMQDDMQDMAGQEVTASGTISALQGGVLEMSVDQAVTNIDGWIAQMEGNPDLSGVRDGLTQLRTELQADEIDGQAVGDLLTDLGNQTAEAAAGAPGQSSQQLEQLGNLLMQAGGQLTGGM